MESFGSPIEMLYADFDDLSCGGLRLALDAESFSRGYVHHDMWLTDRSSRGIAAEASAERDMDVRAILDRAWWTNAHRGENCKRANAA